MPTLSSTMTMARAKGGTLLMGEVVRNRLRRLDRRDRVLEQHVVGAVLLDDDGETIEVLDAAVDLAAVHHADGDGELLAPHVIEENVLDVGASLRFRHGSYGGNGGPRQWSAPTRPDRRTSLD